MNRAGVAIVLAGLAASRSVFAEEPPARLVVLTIEGPEAEATELAATVAELTSRMHVRTVRTDPPEGTEVLARVRVDLRERATAHVELAGKHGQRPLVRDVSRAGSPSIARETLAHTIRAGVEAQVFEEERIAAEQVAAPPPPPPPPPVRAPPVEAPPPPPPATPRARPVRPDASGWGADVGAFVSGGPIASDSGVAPRVGALVAVGLRSRLSPALQVSAGYAPPFVARDEAVVHASVWHVPIRVSPSVVLVRGARVDLVASAGVGLDLLGVDPRSDVLPRSALQNATTRVDPLVTAALGARIVLAPRVYVFGLAGVDVDLATRPYVVDRGGERETVFVPWRVRPAITLGIAFSALGAPYGKGP